MFEDMDPTTTFDKMRRLEKIVRAYSVAADKFIGKVERGEARSRETYADLKAARVLAREEGY